MENSTNSVQTAACNSAWAKPTSVWGTNPLPLKCSLQEVMSEQLAVQLQNGDEFKFHDSYDKHIQNNFDDHINDETNNDFLLAQMLQHEFDVEHDKDVKKKETFFNGTNKVALSYDKHLQLPSSYKYESDESSSDEEESPEWGFVDEINVTPKFKNGVHGKGENMVSKHDLVMSAEKNAKKVFEEFPPGFETGDSEGINMKLNNRVFNALKVHSESESKRQMRLHEKKEHYSYEKALDEKTRLILFKLRNNGVLENVNGVIATGKESIVIHCKGGYSDDTKLPEECALKIFKTTLLDFKTRAKYIKGDYRFMKDAHKKQNPRRIIKQWAIKEYQNLLRMRKYDIPCPEVFLLKKHVLVMKFIGEDNQPAPKLKDANLTSRMLSSALDQCLMYMEKMYKKCGLVHADLSPYNMLWYKDNLYFIDVSQAVEKHHPLAYEFLLKDCENVTHFFRSNCAENVPTVNELFNRITDLDLDTSCEKDEFLSQIQEYEKNEERLQFDCGKEFAFDYHMSKLESNKQNASNENNDA